MEYPKITFTMTTGGRLELFFKTMDSFLENCLDQDIIKEWIISDDRSSDIDIKKMKAKYPFLKIYKSPQYGQPASLDFLFSKVKTEWFFHCEDDWLFIKKDYFIRKLLDIAFSDVRIKNIVLRYWQGVFIKHKKLEYYMHIYNKDSIGNANEMEIGRKINNWSWYGYSFNPGLQNTEVIKLLGKNMGKIEDRKWDQNTARKYLACGFKTANLTEKYIEHIGAGINSCYNRNNQHLIKYKNIHKDQACFVIGSAPSLNQLDLTKLKGEYLLGSNQIYRYYKDGLPEIDYYFIGDYTCLPKREADKKDGYLVDKVGERFHRAGGYQICIEKFPDSIPYYLKKDGDMVTNGFRIDIDNELSHGYTIIHETLAFAIFMGFNPIIIIGVDMYYENPAECLFPVDKALKSFENIKKVCDKKNIRIYNAGKGGILEVFHRIDYNDLF